MAYAILYFILVEELKHSLGMVTNTRCNAWVLGDLNYPSSPGMQIGTPFLGQDAFFHLI